MPSTKRCNVSTEQGTTLENQAITLKPSTSMQQGNPGEVVTHTLSLSSNGTETFTDTVLLSMENNHWQTTILPTTITTKSLMTRTSIPITITVTIPTTATADMRDKVRIMATYQSDETGTSQAVANLTTNVLYIANMDLTVESDTTQKIAPKSSAIYTMTLTNNGNGFDRFQIDIQEHQWETTLAVSHYPSSVYDTMTIVELAAQSSVVISVKVTVPAQPATPSDSVTIAVYSLNDSQTPPASAQAECTTTIGQPGLTFIPLSDSRTAQAGKSITYTLLVQNNTTIADRFDLTIDGTEQDWSRAIVSSLDSGETGSTQMSLDMPAGERQNIKVRMTIPSNAPAERRDTASLVAVSQRYPTAVTTATLKTTVENLQVVEALVIDDIHAKQAIVGTQATYSFQIRNTSQRDQSIQIAHSGEAWETTLRRGEDTSNSGIASITQNDDSLTIILLPRGQVTIAADVAVPVTAQPGATDSTTVTMTSGGGQGVEQASFTFTTTAAAAPTVEKHNVYIPMVNGEP